VAYSTQPLHILAVSLRAKLKDRIQELDHPSELKFAQQLQERIQAMERRGLR